MRTRTVFVVGMSTSALVGIVRLFEGTVVRTAVAVGALVAVAIGSRAVVVARARWRRLRSWPRPGEVDLSPQGPRRVLLADTGLARAE